MKKLVYFVLIISLFCCCAPKQDEVERIIEDGVEVVLNFLEPYKISSGPTSFNLEEEIVIDMEREDLSELGTGRIDELDVDVDGNIYFSYR